MNAISISTILPKSSCSSNLNPYAEIFITKEGDTVRSTMVIDRESEDFESFSEISVVNTPRVHNLSTPSSLSLVIKKVGTQVELQIHWVIPMIATKILILVIWMTFLQKILTRILSLVL